jgi:hypothetical protein
VIVADPLPPWVIVIVGAEETSKKSAVFVVLVIFVEL